MSDLNKEKITALATLCRLEFSDEELPRIQKDLEKILGYMEQLSAVDVGALAPYSHMEEQSLSSQRKDEIHDLLPRETFLANAPDQVSGMIRVPTVIHHVQKER